MQSGKVKSVGCVSGVWGNHVQVSIQFRDWKSLWILIGFSVPEWRGSAGKYEMQGASGEVRRPNIGLGQVQGHEWVSLCLGIENRPHTHPLKSTKKALTFWENWPRRLQMVITWLQGVWEPVISMTGLPSAYIAITWPWGVGVTFCYGWKCLRGRKSFFPI